MKLKEIQIGTERNKEDITKRNKQYSIGPELKEM